MQKIVKVFKGAEGIKFGFGERDVVVKSTMAIEDAENIQKLYPGVYVEVITLPEIVAVEEPAKTAKTGKTADSAK